jgi:hypothetical protein
MTFLTEQANVRRGLEAEIEHTHCDDFLNPCACIEHRGEEGVITMAIGRPVNCGQPLCSAEIPSNRKRSALTFCNVSS